MSKSFPAFRLKHTTKLCAFVLAMILVMSSVTSRASNPHAFQLGIPTGIGSASFCTDGVTSASLTLSLVFTDLTPGLVDTIFVLSGPTAVAPATGNPSADSIGGNITYYHGSGTNYATVHTGGTSLSPAGPINLYFSAGATGVRTMQFLLHSPSGLSDTLTLNVTLTAIPPQPSVFGNYNEVHVGDSITFNHSGSNAGAWSTSFGNATVGVGASGVAPVNIIGTTIGADSVIYTLTSTGCGSSHGAFPISVLTNIAPVISSTAGSGIPGTTLVINGTGFNSVAGKNIIYFGGIRAGVPTGSATSLSVTIPYGVSYAGVTVLDSVSHLSGTSLSTFTPNYDVPAFITSTLFSLKPFVSFSANPAPLTQTQPYSIEYADIDGDGKPDMVVCGTGTNNIIVFRNTSTKGIVAGSASGSSSYATPLYFPTRPVPINLKVGDLDADGKQDVVVACAGAGALSVLKNISTPGHIAFASQFYISLVLHNGAGDSVGYLPAEVTLGDFNNDGRLDIGVVDVGIDSLVSGLTFKPSVMVIRNMYNRDTVTTDTMSASSFFVDSVRFYAPFRSSPTSITTGDVDGDGKLDLVVSDHHRRCLDVYRNTSVARGAITFAPRDSIFVGSNLTGSPLAAKAPLYNTGRTDYPEQTRLGDLDGDGLPELMVTITDSDLVTTNIHNNIAVFKNSSTVGNLSFGTKISIPTHGVAPVCLTLSDLNSDGKLDIVNSNSASGTLSLIKNISSGGSIVFDTSHIVNTGIVNAGPISVAVADVDSNTVPDITTVERSTGQVIIYKLYPIPDTTPIRSVDTVCLGYSIRDTSGHGPRATGYWHASNANVTIVPGVGAADTTATITGAIIGLDTISYMVVHLYDTNWVTPHVIYVKDTAHPGAIVGINHVCVNSTLTLTDPTGINGAWSSGNTARATVDAVTGVVHGVSAGTVNISYTASTSSCGPLSAVKTITVDALPVAGTVLTGPGGVCLGTSVSLSASNAGGAWSSTNSTIATISSTSGSPINVFGASGGTDTIRYIIQSASGNCGADTTIKQIDVITTGSATPINGTASVCQGATTVLTNAQTGGTWSSLNPSVATVVATGASAGTVGGVVTGSLVSDTATIKKVTLFTCATVTSTRVVTVNPLPIAAAITGASSVCIGNTITLSNAGSFGTTTWTSSNTAAATVGASTGVVGAVAGGSTVITDSVTNGCGTVFTTKNVSVSFPPTVPVITGSGPVCQNATVTFTTSTGGGYWTSNLPGTASVAIATSTTATITGGSTGGVAIISYFDTTGCVHVSDTQAIQVNLLPVAGHIVGTDSICFGADTLTNPTAVPTGSWSIVNPAVATINASGIVNRVAVSGTDTVLYTNSNTCGFDIARFAIRINPVAQQGSVVVSPSNILCQGATVTLTNPTATPGGTWSTSAGSGSVTVSGNIATGLTPGAANVIYNVSTVCGSAPAASALVTINDTAHAVISGATTSLCASAADITLSSAGSSVASVDSSWASSNTGVATINPLTGQLHPVGPGNTTIRYIVNTNCNSDTATLLFTITNAAHAGIISPASASICSGGSVTLSSDSTGGNWSSSNTAVATVIGAGSSVTVFGASVAAPTIVTIKYLVSNACNSDFVTASVTVNPVPAPGIISGTPTVCAGASTTLTDNTSGGTWSSTNPAVATVIGSGASVTVFGGSVTVASTDTIIYTTASATCGTVRDTQVITVNPLPHAGLISGFDSVCAGAQITLTSNGDAPGNWTSSNTLVATVGGATGVVTGASTVLAYNTISIKYRVGNSCGFDSSLHSVTVKPTPTAGAVTGLSAVCGGASITLADATGTAGGTWSSSNTAVASVNGSGVVTGSSTITLSTPVTISYSVSSFSCGSGSAPYSITVNPLPNAGGIVGQSTVCAGSLITLSDTGSVGTPSWSSQFPAIASVDASGNVTGLTSGASNISYTVTTPSCGNAFVTHLVTVNDTAHAVVTGAPTTICRGNNVTLSTTGSVGVGSWSSSNSSVASVSGSGVVHGNAVGSATITYITSTVCSLDTATISFTVDTVPSVVTVTGSNQVCQGSDISLTGIPTGGVGVWSNRTGNATVVGGDVHGLTVGVDTIYYSFSAAGCPTAYDTQLVHILPPVSAGTITGLDSVCSNATITLGNTSGSTHYNWSSLNPAIATVDAVTGAVHGVSITLASVSILYTDTSFCGTDTVSKLITVKPLPVASVITGSDSVCSGSTIGLAATGGTSYSWSSANSAVASVNSATGFVTGVSTVLATTTIIYTANSFSCGSDTSHHTVTVNPLPIPGNVIGSTPLCVGNTYGFTTTLTSGLGTGTWSTSVPAVATIDQLTGFLTALSGGNTDIVFTVTNSCGSQPSAAYNLAVNTVPVARINGAHNPVTAPGITAQLCDSATLSYTGSSLGTSPTSFSWSLSNNRAYIVSQSLTGVTVKGFSSGFDTLKYVVTNGCGSDSSFFRINVVPLPVAGVIHGPKQICPNPTTYQYTDTGATTGAGVSYVWSTANGTFINPVLGVLSYGPIGPEVIIYTNTNSCGSAVAYDTIYSNPALNPGVISGPGVVGGTDTICSGTTTTLVSSGIFGDYWSSSNTAIATVNDTTGVVTALAGPGGTVSIYYTDTSYCGALSTQVDMFIRALPVVGFIYGVDTLCVGSSVSLYDTVGAAAGGAWSVTPATVANINASGVLTGSGAGIAVVKYTRINSCGPNFATDTVKVNALPVFTSATAVTTCDSVLLTYVPTADSVSAFAWTRPVVAGIFNAAAAGAGSFSEVLDNLTDQVNDVPINVVYTYTTTAHGCATTTNVTVAVDPTPHLTSAHAETICSGTLFSYLDTLSTGTTGVTANWTRPASPNITPATSAGSGNISEVLTSSVLTGATATYIYTLGYGTCPTHTENVVVSVDPRPGYPQITTHSPNLACSGTLWQNFGSAAAPPAGVNYSWTASNAEVWATGNTRQYCLVNFDKAGDAFVYLLATLPGFNCPSKDSFEVTVSTAVSDRPEVIYFNGDFICLSSDESSYQWGYDDKNTLDSSLFDLETNQNFTVASPDFTHKYYWVMTTHHGCYQKSYYIVPTGVSNVTAAMGDMKLYPNPSSQFVNVEVSNTSGGKYKIEVVNLVGQVVQIEDMQNQKSVLDVSNYTQGVYFVNCYRDGVKFASAKFVKN